MAYVNNIQAITYTVGRTRNPNAWMNADVVFRKLGKPKLEAGERIQEPWRYASHTTDFYQGLTPSSGDRVEFQTSAFYDWKLVRTEMVLSGQDLLRNSGNQNALVKLVTAVVNNAEESHTNAIVGKFFGTQTDAANDPNSFQHIANDTANTLSTGVTLGTISKTERPEWSGTVVSLGGGTNGPTQARLMTAIGSVIDGSNQPDLYVAEPRVLMAWAAGLTANQRYLSADKLTAGFMAFEFMGHPFYAQRHMPYHASTTTVNRIFGVDTSSLNVYCHKDRYMLTEPWTKMTQALIDGLISYKMTAMNFTSDDPRRQLVIHNFLPTGT